MVKFLLMREVTLASKRLKSCLVLKTVVLFGKISEKDK